MAQVLDTDVASFRSTFSGTVLTEGDADYDTARSIWNGAIDRRPAVIARCSTADQVAAAIGFARGQGLDIAVRGGGHSFAGFSVCEGGLMIDLSPMRQVSVDPQERTAVCGGGATWADLDGASQAHGLAVTGGFVSHTGIGGLTLGGGIGWLTKQAGLCCDNLVACDLVTADGRTVRASATENPDLFWALHGGGGNFGVVTSFTYRLHPVGPIVHLGFFFWGVDKGAEALRFTRDFVATLPDDISAFIAGLSAPPAPFVPEQHQLAPGYALLIVGLGSPEEHQQRCAEVRAAVPPLVELVTPIPYAELQHMFDEGNAWGTFGYEKALYVDELSDSVIDVITEYVPQRSSPMSFVPIFVLGGVYAQVSDDGTAFSGSRSARYIINIAAAAPVAELYQADVPWVRDFWSALLPYASGSGSYINFMSEYDEDRVRASFGAAKYERLARVKAEYDPDNVFHLNPNIKPALQPA
jgi:FAD/FMN-containing dehydrogenase